MTFIALKVQLSICTENMVFNLRIVWDSIESPQQTCRSDTRQLRSSQPLANLSNWILNQLSEVTVFAPQLRVTIKLNRTQNH